MLANADGTWVDHKGEGDASSCTSCYFYFSSSALSGYDNCIPIGLSCCCGGCCQCYDMLCVLFLTVLAAAVSIAAAKVSALVPSAIHFHTTILNENV